jgi:hypothetical protein
MIKRKEQQPYSPLLLLAWQVVLPGYFLKKLEMKNQTFAGRSARRRMK